MRLSDDSASDLFHLICGQMIGEGQYRQVFEHSLDKTKVMKHDSGKNWSNISEYQIWAEFQNTPIGKWLAPVDWVSARGLWLIQARTTPIAIGEFPKRVPAIFSDLKPSNWGMLNGRPVCHDYGNHALFTLVLKEASVLKRVVWEHEAT